MLTNRTLALHAGVAVMLAMLAAGCSRSGVQEENERTEAVHAAFDSGAWKAGAPGVRGKMADDLVEKGLLIGKTKAEIEEMLGKPDEESKGALGYFVYYGADKATTRPPYVIRISFDRHANVAREALLDADTSSQYYDMN